MYPVLCIMNTSMNRLFKTLGVAIVMFAPVFLAQTVFAAQLYLTPASSTLPPGETAVLDLRLDPQGPPCVNAAEVNVGFPKNLLEGVDVGRGNSIFTLWVEPPMIKQDFGLITLTGGIPGGYCGRTPGDPALTNVIATLVFRAYGASTTVPADAKVSILNTSKVLLNDGKGTPAKFTSRDATLAISFASPPQGNAWTKILKNDKTPPEPFLIEVTSDKAVFDGKFFIVFSTTDKQSGIDHYEVSEAADPKTAIKDLQWRVAASPSVLGDQGLRSIIRVKAVDKAGNERIVEFTPKPAKKSFLYWLLYVLVPTIFLAIIIRVAPRLIPW